MEDISKITKEEKESKIPFKISNEKYDLTGSRFMIDLGYWASGYKGPELYFTYGSQINQYLFVGGGTGIHYMTDYSTVSIPSIISNLEEKEKTPLIKRIWESIIKQLNLI